MDIKFNINREVKVLLTPFGEHIVRTKYGDRYYEELIEKRRDKNGYVSFQLWTLMQDFGPHMQNGCIIPFNANIIMSVNTIDKDDDSWW